MLEEDAEPLMHFSNLNIEDIVTPVDVDKLEQLLVTSNYNEAETRFLISGFREGFDIGYMGPTDRQDESRNMPFRIGNKKILWNKIMKEIKAGRVAGPFSREEIPFSISSHHWD